MANKMLIDAAHPEETRVVVLRGSRVEEFDFEAASKKQLRGNIYLAKVTRVEPSLQAAFVEYGGNRHGFLAFSEIHPDYYQIPVSDRQALIEAEAEEEPEEEERRPRRSRRHRRDRSVTSEMNRDGDATVSEADDETRPTSTEEAPTPSHGDPTSEMIEHAQVMHEKLDAGEALDTQAPPPEEPAPEPAQKLELIEPVIDEPPTPDTPPEAAVMSDAQVDTESTGEEAQQDAGADETGEEEDVSEHVEQLGGDAMEELPMRGHRSRRQYKIQEVIKRRQVLLVQVVKEERGNKGAALTTYLSLAGRYSVLMPNTAKGGGISRKITDAGDRQRLKSIAQELEVPEGMGIILRTAGASRTKPEVKRDYEYLMRMWETVRETTLQSQAPMLVYEEGSLIKRSIRDLYNKDIEEVVVAGEAGYREAKDFMRMLMPSHARNVQPWRDPQPIFAKAGAEAQLDAMFSSHVTLKSGGYLVINQTEALVAIDVNSGRSTREHNIEDTALRTNLEAADEVARQLRLRDLAGLIVVDFIDMEESRNNRAVEKRIKDALKNDRARIQVGRISHFGLLEMSRQRIRTGVLEGSTVVCEHCAGAGMVRSTSSIALHVLRLLEDALIADRSFDLVVRTRSAVALYTLNQKRSHLAELEARFGVHVTFVADESLTGTTYCALERGEPATGVPQPVRPIPQEEFERIEEDESFEDDDGSIEESEQAEAPPSTTALEDGDSDGARRKRRRRRRGRDRESSGIADDAPQPADDALGLLEETPIAADGSVQSSDSPSEETPDADGGRGDGRRRRSRRGGRRSREDAQKRRDDLGASGEADGEPTEGANPLGMQVEEPEIHNATFRGDTGPAAIDRAVPEAVLPDDDAPADVALADELIAGLAESAPAKIEAPATMEMVEPEAAHNEGTTSETTRREPPKIELAEEAPTKNEAPETSSESPEPEPVSASRKPERISSVADPAQPKRSGWWQRAKATLGG